MIRRNWIPALAVVFHVSVTSVVANVVSPSSLVLPVASNSQISGSRSSAFVTLNNKHNHQQNCKKDKQLYPHERIPRGGSGDDVSATTAPIVTLTLGTIIVEALHKLGQFIKGPKSDTLLLLSTTAFNTPLCQKLNVSPILGFLSLGLLLGPNGKGMIQDVHKTEMLADLGIVLFLFEMGIHLDIKTLSSMKRDVFGIGLGQFTTTAIAIGSFCKLALGFSTSAAIIVGWSLALSSSAFVLQLLKDKDEMGTQYGRSSFGTLLLQDLMVVPLLVLTPILSGGGSSSVGNVIKKTVVQIGMALSILGLFGKVFLEPLFSFVSSCQSKEAYIGVVLGTVFAASFLTEGLGLSNTLGAFLSGMLLAEIPKHRHDAEHAASPFRTILVGLFFFTVGFEIDLNMIASNPIGILSATGGIIALKAILCTAICLAFGLPLSTAQRVGLVLSQGGEFAFVAFRTARSSGILENNATNFLMTCVSLTMALTPALEAFGAKMVRRLEKGKVS